MSDAAPAQVVTFRLGEDLFAADIFAVERVLRYRPPTPVPNLPPWIEGVVDYQGRIVPVIDLRTRFELPPRAVRNETRILVFNVQGSWVAAVVDAVVEVAGLASREVAPPPALFRGLAGEYLSGIARRGDRLVIVLDVARILSSTERLALESAAAELAVPPTTQAVAAHG